jgi:hypothetical protein
MIVWTPRTDDQPSLAMGAIAFAPSDSRFVYAGTGEPNVIVQSYAGRGLLKSLDGGSSWSLVAASPFAGTSFSDIRVHQSNPNVLVAATVQGTAGQSETPVRWGPSPGSSSATTGGFTVRPTTRDPGYGEHRDQLHRKRGSEGRYYVRVNGRTSTRLGLASNEVMLSVSMPSAPAPPSNLLGLVNGSALQLAWKIRSLAPR